MSGDEDEKKGGDQPDTPWTDRVERDAVTAPQYGLREGRRWHEKKGGRSSVFIVDATPIVQFRVGADIQRKARNARAKDGVTEIPAESVNPMDILDAISTPDQHTLVLTHTVLRELLRNDTKGHRYSYGLQDGEVKIGPKDMNFSPVRIFARWLRDHKDQTRCYASIDEMIAAGECDAAKGGIVIVDDPRFGTPAPDSQGHYLPPTKNEGEESIITLAHHICEKYTPQMGKGVAVIGTDHDLRSPINNLSLEFPGVRTPKVFNMKCLISALCDTQTIDPSAESELYSLLKRKQDRVESPEAFRADAIESDRIDMLSKYLSSRGQSSDLPDH